MPWIAQHRHAIRNLQYKACCKMMQDVASRFWMARYVRGARGPLARAELSQYTVHDRTSCRFVASSKTDRAQCSWCAGGVLCVVSGRSCWVQELHDSSRAGSETERGLAPVNRDVPATGATRSQRGFGGKEQKKGAQNPPLQDQSAAQSTAESGGHRTCAATL